MVQFYAVMEGGEAIALSGNTGDIDFTPTVTPGGWAYATVDVSAFEAEFGETTTSITGLYEACHCSALDGFSMPEGGDGPPGK